MTAADLEGGTAARTSDSGPVAEISRGALRSNAALLEAVALPSDLPADAWGHGVAAVAEAVRAARMEAATAASGRRSAHAIDTLLGLPGGDGRATPAMRLVGRVLSTKALRAGEGVSYGLTFHAPADTRVALVTGGYAQGVVRALGNRSAVAIGGTTYTIVGRVAMDVCVVDIAAATVRRGAEAVFFGDAGRGEPSIAEWVDATGLGALELVTATGLHARREFVP